MRVLKTWSYTRSSATWACVWLATPLLLNGGSYSSIRCLKSEVGMLHTFCVCSWADSTKPSKLSKNRGCMYIVEREKFMATQSFLFWQSRIEDRLIHSEEGRIQRCPETSYRNHRRETIFFQSMIDIVCWGMSAYKETYKWTECDSWTEALPARIDRTISKDEFNYLGCWYHMRPMVSQTDGQWGHHLYCQDLPYLKGSTVP